MKEKKKKKKKKKRKKTKEMDGNSRVLGVFSTMCVQLARSWCRGRERRALHLRDECRRPGELGRHSF